MSSQPITISAGEVTLVCSHYDLGTVRSVRRFKGGSRSSPKVLLGAERGVFILKRRPLPPVAPAAAAEQAQRVALSHGIILHLTARGFPAPELIGTRDGNSMLQLRGAVYEVFKYVPGRHYLRTPEEARQAGNTLARCHELLRSVRADWPAPAPSPPTYHDHPHAAAWIESLPTRLPGGPIPALTTRLLDAYHHAAAKANRAGLRSLPRQVIHGDWHPGNIIFTADDNARAPKRPAPPPASTGNLVAGVLDFDAARLGPTLIDAANGAWQFGIRRQIEREYAWRILLDPPLYSAFWAGYRSISGDNLGNNADANPAAAIPWLTIEALIMEAVAPIALTGKFGKIDPRPLLEMVGRTVGWLEANGESLVSLALGS